MLSEEDRQRIFDEESYRAQIKAQYMTTAPQAQKPSNGVAAVLSLVIPGAGQMYKGEVGTGLLWLLFVVIGYMIMVIPGIILHLICIFNAASGKK